MIEFDRTIVPGEVRSYYLNLTDDRGRTFGADVGLVHREKIAIIDGQNRITDASGHGKNQVWGSLKSWYRANEVNDGAFVRVKFDPSERREGLRVLHLIKTSGGSSPDRTPPAQPEAQSASEIPPGFERQIEDFLSANPALIEKGLTLYEDSDGHTGQQYPTEVGPIDLLCKRPTGQLLVIELKRSHVSDRVVGQVSRYVGWVMQNLADDAGVAGLILSHERDANLEYAVHAHPNLSLRYYKIRLELVDGGSL